MSVFIAHPALTILGVYATVLSVGGVLMGRFLGRRSLDYLPVNEDGPRTPDEEARGPSTTKG